MRVAEQQRVQVQQEADLLRSHAPRIGGVPRVDGVLAVAATEREVPRPGDQLTEELVVVGAIDDDTLRAPGQ